MHVGLLLRPLVLAAAVVLVGSLSCLPHLLLQLLNLSFNKLNVLHFNALSCLAELEGALKVGACLIQPAQADESLSSHP